MDHRYTLPDISYSITLGKYFICWTYVLTSYFVFNYKINVAIALYGFSHSITVWSRKASLMKITFNGLFIIRHSSISIQKTSYDYIN